MQVEKVAVVGASGYSGEELIRLLARHPGVELVCVTSRQHAGKPLAAVHPRFAGGRFGGVAFAPSDAGAVIASGAAFAFLALPHGLASEFARPLLAGGLRVIDLSADFRLRSAEVYREFYGEEHPAPELLARAVYGMPETHREEIRGAELVASPGCYPTSAILPLYPLLERRVLDPETIVINSLSGVSGAGRKAVEDYLFVECNENARAYGLPKHRHLSEIEQELSAAAGAAVRVSFAPHLIPLSRGILTTIHASLAPGVEPGAVGAALEEKYAGERFVRLLGETRFAEIKHVALTNFIEIGWRHDPRTGRVILSSAEDNLVKGASGQAIQSFNLMTERAEDEGLV